MIFLVGCSNNQPTSIGDEAREHINKWSSFMKESNAEKVANLYSDPYTYLKMFWEDELEFVRITESREVLKDELEQQFSEMSCTRCSVTIKEVVANDTSATIVAGIDLYISSDDGKNYYSHEGFVQWIIEKQGEHLYIVYENTYYPLQ